MIQAETDALFWGLRRLALQLTGERAEEAAALPTLRRLHSGLVALAAEVGGLLGRAELRHGAELAGLRDAIAAPGPPSPRPPRPLPAPPPRLEVGLAPGVALEAALVPPELTAPQDILGAVATPELHYIARWDHFAFRVGATVFHGNVGDFVYPGFPKKTARRRECRRPGCRGAGGGCRYYHDPARHPGARDIRDFGAEAWAPSGLSGGGRGRALGSRATLVGDLGTAAPEAVRRQLDLVAHELLCGLILAKYAPSPAGPTAG